MKNFLRELAEGPGRLVVLLLPFVLAAAVGSCTQQQRARNYGGTATIELPKGQKLVNATWKGDDDLWYLYRPMRAGEQPETTIFQESAGGLITGAVKSGTVIFKESR